MHSHGKKQICAGKSSSYSLYNCFGKIKACWHWIDCVSPYYLAILLKRIPPYCRVHFSLLQNAFLLTAECISPYCNWSLKDPAHHIPNQTEIATEEFCPKSLLRKQNEIDFIESHFQILNHLKIVHFFFCGFLDMCGVCGMVMGVVLRAAGTFSSIHSCSD